MQTSTQPRYTSRIIKASALIADTKTLLAAWNPSQSARGNLDRLRRENVFGKTSRTRSADVLRIFRQRYFDRPEIGETLVSLTQQNAPAQWIDPLLYFFTAQNDETLHDIVTDTLYTRKQAGYVDLPPIVVQNALRSWANEQKTTSRWSDETTARVTRNSLATLRDFGILGGAAHKYINPIYLPLPSFALIAFWLMQELQSGNRVLRSEEWRLFFLDVTGVERLFLEAHQEGLLSYYAAGSVVRLEFPASTLKDYADGLLKRAY